MYGSVIHADFSTLTGEESDDYLVRRFQHGDKGAFRPLVERHQERVRNLIHSIFQDPDIVDDLAQDVFIRLYEALDRFRFESSLSTFLYRIAVNRSRDELRHRRSSRFLPFHDVLHAENGDSVHASDPAAEGMESSELVDFGLRSLPEKLRIAIVLKDIEGLSYEEMAQTMNCRIGTVKSRLARGRQRLRQVLGPMMEDL